MNLLVFTDAAESTVHERFWNLVEKTDSCWLWVGCRGRTGYGKLTVNGKYAGAHRRSFEIHNGSIPEDMCVLHRCDNPPCVNPEHLFLGTQQENVKDMNQKGRRAPTVGTANPKAKITEVVVGEIDRLYIREKSIRRVSRELRLPESLISDVVHRRSWKHVSNG